MKRDGYLNLAAQGHAMPIGTDLVFHEQHDCQAVLLDGLRLGRVVEQTARRWRTPLALPLMDLRVEKAALCGAMGIQADKVDTFHFAGKPDPSLVASIPAAIAASPSPRMKATCEAIRYVAGSCPDLTPIGMCIGPFSLMTKLLSDPITPVYLAGTGVTAEQDDEVAAVETVLELSIEVILAYLRQQLAAGARAMVVCEPAANVHYLSPKQLQAGSDLFDRYVMRLDLRIKKLLADHGAELIFHDCGELTDDMVRKFAVELDPVILSLGSSRVLWEDQRLVPKHVVLYGNLPSKKFYSDSAITAEQVTQRSAELVSRMRAAGHPFILGSECDVLSVPGCESVIKGKIDAMLACGCGHHH